jgi:hypothetical protein
MSTEAQAPEYRPVPPIAGVGASVSLDIPTLFVIAVFVSAVAGFLLLLSWFSAQWQESGWFSDTNALH